jgi:phosphoglycerol transferase MdoB-like AlkP superfamily enzyme
LATAATEAPVSDVKPLTGPAEAGIFQGRDMLSFFNRYATPFITGFFLISLITGVALFVHLGPSAFREMHEWLSIVLILPFALHIWKNWKPMVTYLKRAPMAVALGVSLLACVPFFVSTGTETRSGPPAFAFTTLAFTHSADDLAPVLGLTGDQLREKLTAAGYAFTAPDQPLSDVAAAKGADANALLAVLMAAN